MKYITNLLILVGIICSAGAEELPSAGRYEKEYSIEKSYDYLIHFPESYSSDGEPVGLMLFLHGSGERGNDLESLKKWGPPKLIAEGSRDFPAIVVSPQCPQAERWDPYLLKHLIHDLSDRYNVDRNRIYVTGLSMGGYGTWALAGLMHEELAAIVPICGGGDPQITPKMNDLPCWVFHGAKDTVVDLYDSTRMVSSLNNLNAPTKFTVYPEADHVGAWVEAYDNSKMWEWLWRQNLKTRQEHLFQFGLPDPRRFEAEIVAFESRDQETFPDKGGILCVGSSSMKGWHPTIHEDLAPLDVIPRGFGGSHMSDVLYYFDRIIMPYEPRAILLYEGDNDAASGVSPFLIAEQMNQFVKKVHTKLPECRIYVLSTKPSLSRWNIWPSMKLTNKIVEELCRQDDRLFYLDVADSMLGEDGLPEEEIFASDKLHMNELGYQRWKAVVKPILMEHELRGTLVSSS